MNIALFGGSFDPPHKAHLKIIKKATKILDIDRLIVMPTYLNPFKTDSFAPATKRLKWLKKASKNFKNVIVSDYEIRQNRSVYTIESINYLNSIGYNVKYLIIGADNLHSLKRWKNYEELSKLIEFVVVSRDKIAVPDRYKRLNLNINISSTYLRESLNKKYIPKKIKKNVIKHYRENYGKIRKN